jgi:site-specific recombinase XerD
MVAYLDWCRRHRYWALPTDPSVLVFYLDELAVAGTPYSTIERRVYGISFIHQMHGHLYGKGDAPHALSHDPTVRAALSRLSGQCARKRSPIALTGELISAVLQHQGPHQFGSRDAAMITLQYGAGLKPYLLTKLQPADVQCRNDGITIRLRDGYKRNAAQRLERFAPAMDDPYLDSVREFGRYRSKLGGHYSYLFPGANDASGCPMATRHVSRIYKSMALRAGIMSDRISGESPRLGLIADLASAKVEAEEIALQTGHVGLGVVHLRDLISTISSPDAIRERSVLLSSLIR